MTLRIAIVGAGNMGGALVAGLRASPETRRAGISVMDVDPKRTTLLKKRFRVQPFPTVGAAVQGAQVLVLCVKPQQMAGVLCELAGHVTQGQVVLSVAAGVGTRRVERALGRVPVIRVMPNTPALLRAGALVYTLGRWASARHEALAKRILSVLGPLWKVPENYLDAVTALSGSGPAYVFHLAECLSQAGTALGLPSALAQALAHQTVYGAGRMLAEAGEPAGVLRQRVTSPGGTTEAAFRVLRGAKLETIYRKALAAACRRSGELSAEPRR